jgi:hypothetical protein
MRKIKTILLVSVAVVALMQPVRAAVRSGDPVSVSTKDDNLFVVKTDRKFKGAHIEILFSNGDFVTAQKMDGRKIIIDFGDMKEGSYIIRVSKGDQVKQFQYEKR